MILVAAFTGMWLAPGPLPQAGIIVALLAGIGLTAAGAGLLNNYLDRNLDQTMNRTEDRPLPAGRIRADRALAAGFLSGGTGIIIVLFAGNVIAALLLFVALISYVPVYTTWAKHRTTFATEIGSLPGALAPVIGWSALSPEFALAPVLLFFLMLFWQPLHFYSLGIHYQYDYRKADLPILPAEKGTRGTRHRMIFYTLAVIGVTCLMVFTESVGNPFLYFALTGGAGLLGLLLWYMSRRWITYGVTRITFLGSLVYLFIIYAGFYV